MASRDCRRCDTKAKIKYGCEGNPKEILEFDGERLNRCPRRAVLDNPMLYSEVFRLYRFYKNGFLPYPGGMENQAYKLSCFFGIMDSIMNKIQRDELNKER